MCVCVVVRFFFFFFFPMIPRVARAMYTFLNP